jgi:hypothetical protein
MFPPATAFFSSTTPFEFFLGGISAKGDSQGSTSLDGESRGHRSYVAFKNLYRDWSTRTGTPAVYEVLQLPGDIVYVPAQWGHAVLNLADTIAVAFEFQT